MRLPSSLCFPVLLVVAFCSLANRSGAQQDFAPVELLISVPDQKMLVLREGGLVKKYKVSTSRFGIGDSQGSYKTPPGRMRVWEKLGGDLPSGAVIKHRAATGEILPVNAPGRDPIVSRILWLEGLESQNDNARGRGIYIHGTTEEANIGKPVSWGCFRMRSQDVIDLYEMIAVGAVVTISEAGLPHFPKWKPAPPVIIASQTAAVRPVAEPMPRPRRVVSERQPAVGELLRPDDGRVARADPGAADAFGGSILFAGLPSAPKIAAKSPAKVTAKPAIVPERAQSPEPFALAAAPPIPDEFSIRLVDPDPPLRLMDIRRVSVAPLLASVSMFTAPPPDVTLADSPRMGMRPPPIETPR